MRALLLPLLCCWSLSAVAQTTVESFTPVGEVKKIRQVTARFSAPMVAFGDLRARAPFAVDCAEKGSGRWIDATTWSYDFERDLPGAVACRFVLPADRRDLAGQPLAGQREFGFSTGGPAVVQALPRAEGARIDEQQVFVLGLDAPARDDTISKNAWCGADGIGEKIGVRLLAGAEREAVLANRRAFVDRYLTLYFRSRGVDWSAKLPLRARMNEQLPIVVLQCRRPLPADAAVKLVWGAGIAAANGIATTQDQTLAYRTRPDFTASLSCERVTAKSGCIPFLPVSLGFSAPVATSSAAQIYMAGPGGKRYPVKLSEEDAKAPFVSQVSIAGPFPERTALALHLPPDLKDDAGRTLQNRARFPLRVPTGDQPPLVKFAAPFGVIESRGERMLPVTVRNVEPALAAAMRSAGASLRLGGEQDAEVLRWLTRLTGSRSDWTPGQPYGRELERPVLAGAKDAAVRRFELPKPNGRRAFE
ncbi:MAG TPA: alpha-2-macroglobulin, partial [Telluria sp.]